MTTQLAFEDVMDNTRIRIRMRNWSAIVLVVAITSACGDSSGVFSAASLDDARTTPWDTGGILTLTEANAAGGEILSVIEVSFDQNRARRDLAVGEWPWRHPDGTLYYLATCGRQTNYVAVLDVFGSSSSASPCSDTVPNDGYSPTKFTYIMASPDQRRMAMEVRWYDRDLNVHYDTVIFEDNSIIATYEGFYAPAWLDNETLVMPSGNGLYTVNIGNAPQLLATEISGDGGPRVNNPDVSPDGRQIVFEWGGAIWLIGATGDGLRKLADDEQNLRYPAWSPDGQFVAFMRIQSPGQFDHLFIPVDPLNFAYLSNANERQIHYVDVRTLERWVGYFNEAMATDKMPQGQLSWSVTPN